VQLPFRPPHRSLGRLGRLSSSSAIGPSLRPLALAAAGAGCRIPAQSQGWWWWGHLFFSFLFLLVRPWPSGRLRLAPGSSGAAFTGSGGPVAGSGHPCQGSGCAGAASPSCVGDGGSHGESGHWWFSGVRGDCTVVASLDAAALLGAATCRYVYGSPRRGCRWYCSSMLGGRCSTSGSVLPGPGSGVPRPGSVAAGTVRRKVPRHPVAARNGSPYKRRRGPRPRASSAHGVVLRQPPPLLSVSSSSCLASTASSRLVWMSRRVVVRGQDGHAVGRWHG